MADASDTEIAFDNILISTRGINQEIGKMVDTLKPYSRRPDFEPHDPAPVGMHGTKLDEIARALAAVQLNLAALNNMFQAFVGLALKNQS
ncbi:MAG: hypothetical protein JO340_04605 [Acidobacteriaceae bacterium]|nr:hypothetical protein [Acidobacteriaceae bacterium]